MSWSEGAASILLTFVSSLIVSLCVLQIPVSRCNLSFEGKSSFCSHITSTNISYTLQIKMSKPLKIWMSNSQASESPLREVIRHIPRSVNLFSNISKRVPDSSSNFSTLPTATFIAFSLISYLWNFTSPPLRLTFSSMRSRCKMLSRVIYILYLLLFSSTVSI